jgi:CheY-like chemotaxis protein
VRSKKHFLVVDDSELSLRVTEMLLNSFGISGDYVSGADAAFTALSRRDYDLVLIDYLMPGMNGIETVEVIRRMAGGQRRGYYANLPIIILTAEENEEADFIKLFIDKTHSIANAIAVVDGATNDNEGFVAAAKMDEIFLASLKRVLRNLH